MTERDDRRIAADALAVIDRQSDLGWRHTPRVEIAYSTLATAMDRIFGPLPPPLAIGYHPQPKGDHR